MDYEKRFKELLYDSVKKSIDDEVAVAFSGGIDSLLLAYLMKDFCKTRLYVTGLKQSYDIDAAKTAAEKIGLPLEVLEITEEEIESAIGEIIRILSDLDIKEDTSLPPKDPTSIITISFNMPFYFVAKNCREKLIVSGQGPDTYLGGFTKHLQLSEKELEKELEKNTYDLIHAGSKQHQRIAESFGKSVTLPYLDKELLEFSLKLPVEWKIRDGKRKYILVRVAKLFDIPEDLAERTKKSAQYGSGIMKALKKIAKKKGVSVGELANLE